MKPPKRTPKPKPKPKRRNPLKGPIPMPDTTDRVGLGLAVIAVGYSMLADEPPTTPQEAQAYEALKQAAAHAFVDTFDPARKMALEQAWADLDAALAHRRDKETPTP